MATISSGLGLSLSVTFDTTKLVSFLDLFYDGMSDISGGPLGEGFVNAALDWEHDLRIRFAILSQGGGAWAPLPPAYARRKIKAVGHDLILFYFGQLSASLQPEGEGNVFFQHPEGVVFGSEDRTVYWHQFRTENMPARPVFVDPQDPDMPYGTLDRMHIDIEQGTLQFIDQCIASL